MVKVNIKLKFSLTLTQKKKMNSWFSFLFVIHLFFPTNVINKELDF